MLLKTAGFSIGGVEPSEEARKRAYDKFNIELRPNFVATEKRSMM